MEGWDPAIYQDVLGDEIRKLRAGRGWTRTELAERLSISPQTLATYEYGTRQCTIGRLVQICQALNTWPHELLAGVHARLFPPTTGGPLSIDLRAVVQDQQSELRPLRRWASSRLATAGTDGDTWLRLAPSTLESLAWLCGLASTELVDRLHRLNETPADPPHNSGDAGTGPIE